MECATDARYLYDLLRRVLHAPIYLDSSTLSDLRQLFTDGIHQSDTVLLMASSGDAVAAAYLDPSSLERDPQVTGCDATASRSRISAVSQIPSVSG